MRGTSSIVLSTLLALIFHLGPRPAFAQDGLQKVKHIVIAMQENHSFDNYFGALAFAPGSPYHTPAGVDHDGHGACQEGDHRCVDGLSCTVDASGEVHCFNSNIDDSGHSVFAFHDSRRCVPPDLDHEWLGTHKEANFLHPNDALGDFRADGFVRQSDLTEQLDNGVESPTEDQTMSFYNQKEIPFYYDLAQKFAISDRYFSSLLGPTFPNRSYLLAATSFGHLTTNDVFPPPGGYKPISGTIFDLLDKHNVTWADYFSDLPQGASFRLFSATGADPHFLPLQLFLAQAAGVPGAGPLPEVAFVDPNFGVFGIQYENDEHPPTDIQRGQAFVSQVVAAVRNGPNWKDSIIFIVYDEHGGFFDHARPPRAPQGHARTPDGISPGECSANFVSVSNTSVEAAEALCPALAANPTGPFPEQCASFDQLGMRVPFLAVSPFSKPHYVSHTVGDHTSLLALIEKRFLSADENETNGEGGDNARPHLTRRDQYAHTLEDLFDFEHSPSLDTLMVPAAPPAEDCTPVAH